MAERNKGKKKKRKKKRKTERGKRKQREEEGRRPRIPQGQGGYETRQEVRKGQVMVVEARENKEEGRSGTSKLDGTQR